MKNLDIWQHYMNHFSPKPLHQLSYQEFNNLAQKVARIVKKENPLGDLKGEVIK